MRLSLPTARAPWFLAERLLAQAGGLALVAGLARATPPADAAVFISAYALASLFQPLLANACQPVLIRLVQAGRWGDAGVLLGALLVLAGAIAGAVIALAAWAGLGLLAAIFIHVAFAPLALVSAPLIADDRWRAVLTITIPASAFGILALLSVLFSGGDLVFVAALFVVEPLGAGIALMRRAKFAPAFGAPRWVVLAEAAPLILGMGASSLFWRSPVLIAALFLQPTDVLQIAFAMQLVTGMLLLPNALCQSLVGLLSKAGGACHAALSAGGAAAVVCGFGAVAGAALLGQPMMTLIYGAAAAGSGQMLMVLSPVVGLGLVWRLVEVSAALSGLSRALVLTRFAALGGQAVLLVVVLIWPTAMSIALATPLSLAFAAIVVPVLLPSLRDTMSSIGGGALSALSREGLRASRAVFARA